MSAVASVRPEGRKTFVFGDRPKRREDVLTGHGQAAAAPPAFHARGRPRLKSCKVHRLEGRGHD
jgi:hypothetical protein